MEQHEITVSSITTLQDLLTVSSQRHARYLLDPAQDDSLSVREEPSPYEPLCFDRD